MIAALVVERMPEATADELPLPVIHLAVGVGEGESCGQLRMLAPATGGTVDGVVGVPVVDILAPLAREDTFVNIVLGIVDVVGPVIEHIVVVLHTGGVHVSCSHRTTGPGVFLAGNLQGLQRKVLRIAGLVKDGLPHEYTGVVAVATDDVAGVLMYHLAPLGVFVPELPTRGRNDDEEPQLVAGIHKRWVLRIVGRADDGHASLLQTHDIAPLLGVGQGIAHVGEVLMTVAAHKLVIGLAVEPETILTAELCLADAHADNAAVG